MSCAAREPKEGIFMDDALLSTWKRALARFDEESTLPPSARGILSLSTPLGMVAGTILVAVPNAYAKTSIDSPEIQRPLTATLSELLGRSVKVAVSVDEDAFTQPAPAAKPTATPAPTAQPAVPASSPEPATQPAPAEPPEPSPVPHETPLPPATAAQASSDSHLNPNYTFSTFVIGSSNRFATAAAKAAAENPGHAYNPLFIFGGSGLGKTHLLHAIGHEALSLRPDLKVKYVNSEEFTNDFINSIATGRSLEFQNRYRAVDILLVDDIQFLQGKEQTIEEFFHTFNALHTQGSQIVITSDMPPKRLGGFEERMRSRFEWGLQVDIQPADLETRIAILSTKAEQERIEVELPVLEYIAARFSTNIRELEGALVRVTAFASLSKQPITTDLAAVVLKDNVSDPATQEITASLIKTETSKYFNVTTDALCSASRSRALTEARQIAMYLCRELTDLSLPAIGQEFGGRDHTTVMYANKKITEAMGAKPKVYNDVTELTSKIRMAARSR